MQTFNVEFVTFEDQFPTRAYDVAIDAKLLALSDDDSDDLVYELAAISKKAVGPGCIMYDMLDDAARGGCTVEERDDLGSASAAPGTRTFCIYFSPSCFYEPLSGIDYECKRNECDCEGDIGIITLTPAD